MRYKLDSNEQALKRKLLLDTAFELFSARSINEVNMTQIAEAARVGAATAYRYFGVKQKLVVELGTDKWREFADEVEVLYEKKNGEAMTALEEFAFYLESYIELFRRHPKLVKFNADFDRYVIREQIPPELLAGYFDSVKRFSDKFAVAYAKNKLDHTIRSDLTETELFLSGMYTMLAASQKFADGLIYPADNSFNCERALSLQKEMFLAYVKA